MECMVGALKSSLRKEMAIELSPQTFMEELNVPNGTSCDNFFVDDLLDLSQLEEEPEQQQQQKEEDTTRVSVQQENNQTNEIQYSFKGDYGASELSVPADDVADLEWLSHFVEDSFSAAFPTVAAAENHLKKDPEPAFTQACFKTPVQTKARSKRTRTGVRVWSLGSPSFTDSSSASASASASSSSSSPSSPFLIYAQTLDQVSSPSKKPKKKHSSENAPAQAPRRCSHCGVQKTPQWRTGPNGPKTLCNACGVRFKSGRLLPEYRPACSPTFSSELHSNHHRKVLEMRRKKEEIVDGVDSVAPPAPVVPSF